MEEAGHADHPASLAESLQRVTEAALAYLDLESLLNALLERVVAILGVDTSAILLVDEETNELAARAARGLEEEVDQGFRLPVGKGFAGTVAAKREPVVIRDLKPGDAVNPLLYEKKIRSLLGVPLIVESRLLGVLHVGSLTVRPFSDEDVTIMQVVADRVALAIAHAEAFENERRARADAERSLERLSHMQAVTDSALVHLDLDQLMSVLLERVVQALNADTSVILLVDEEGTSLVATYALGLEEEVERGFTLPIGEGFAGTVASERRPIARPVKPGLVVNPLMSEKGVKRLLGVPLIVERRLIGVLHVGTLRDDREFSEEDAELLQAVGDRVALAIEHDRLFEQERVAEMLQRSLLPSELPQAPGLSLSARYLPAAAKRLVGGDWFDVLELPGGRVGVAIGDVVGHGIEAATLMGALRNALQAYALQGLSPAAIAPLLARFAASAAGRAQMATYVYGVIDAERHTFTFVNASHPAPLVVRPDGSAEIVESPLLPPVGAALAPAAEEKVIELDPGATVVLYTDGLIEKRGERLSARREALHAAAARAAAEPDLLCETLIDAMLDGPPDDDVAVLSVQRMARADEALNLRVAARPEELAAIRRLLRGWLVDAGADRRAVEAVLLASGEACTNAIEHAYGPGERTFELEGTREGDDVILVIRDEGRWRAPRGQNRGRGLGLMETFMDDVAVVPSDSGTEVRMRRRITG